MDPLSITTAAITIAGVLRGTAKAVKVARVAEEGLQQTTSEVGDISLLLDTMVTCLQPSPTHCRYTWRGRLNDDFGVINLATGFQVQQFLTPMEIIASDQTPTQPTTSPSSPSKSKSPTSHAPSPPLIDRRFSTFKVKSTAENQWVNFIHQQLQSSVLDAGCSNWYINEHGQNAASWRGMRKETMLLASILSGFLPGATVMTINAFHKIGFDLDVIGRQREIASIEEKARLNYEKAGTSVNIAIWNMHVPVNHQFEDILETGLQPMGRGGGFRIVVFRGSGYIKNEGAGGFDNWRCSGNWVQHDNVVTFKATT
ncbi:hypothetical protein P171DRAFT_485935 [Karstenula rhodostoma CBS 690.94]|uniref:Uncharacterized protein n=1 Tax=Karstenula rhodostoma CBS 690.94 TaxID=1392251 RepID=A0A9P4UBT4_9PLEO|nr:hypothetical protein P171DRAFT_485935 [Karstenula rhodostoma CBS 690.94]